MFFEISKIAWFVVSPGNITMILLTVGVAMLWTPWRRVGKHLLTFVTVVALAIAILPIGRWLLLPLENRFPTVQSLPEHVDGILVLGGMVDPIVSNERGQISLNDAIERLTEAALLARQYPNAKFVFSGGSGSLSRQDLKEADIIAPLLELMGLDGSRVLFENQSRNTAENAVFSYRLARPTPGETWILITSAIHMPRAVGCFREAGWAVFPHPVDYKFKKSERFEWSFNLQAGLGNLTEGIHEWLGLLFYWLTGRSDSIFPGPDPAR